MIDLTTSPLNQRELVCLFICLSVCLSVCPSFCLSVCLSNLNVVLYDYFSSSDISNFYIYSKLIVVKSMKEGGALGEGMGEMNYEGD